MIKLLGLALAVLVLVGCGSSAPGPVAAAESHDAATSGEDAGGVVSPDAGGTQGPETGTMGDAGSDAGELADGAPDVVTFEAGPFDGGMDAGGEDASDIDSAPPPPVWTWGCFIPGLATLPSNPYGGFNPFNPCYSPTALQVSPQIQGSCGISGATFWPSGCAPGADPGPVPTPCWLSECLIVWAMGTVMYSYGTATHACSTDADCMGLPASQGNPPAAAHCGSPIMGSGDPSGYCTN